MGFLDKVKAQAEQAVTKAQQGVAQGQAKLDTMQARKQLDKLLRDLGAAVYAEQRQGGPGTAVATAVSAIDQHAATQGPIDLSDGPAAPQPGVQPGVQPGDFTIDG